jgi:hypothetical protein
MTVWACPAADHRYGSGIDDRFGNLGRNRLQK